MNLSDTLGTAGVGGEGDDWVWNETFQERHDALGDMAVDEFFCVSGERVCVV